MTERTTRVDPSVTATISVAPIYSQSCLCCNNTRYLPTGVTYSNIPWVCDECKEAISFLKFLKNHDQELMNVIMKSK